MSERADIDQAVSLMTTKVGGKREIKKLPDHLHQGETVRRISTGQYGGGMGILVLTDRRLLFLKDGMMKQTSEDFPLDRISSVQWSSGMLTGKIQVFVSGNKSEIENVSKTEGKAIVDDVRAHTVEDGGVPAPSTPDGSNGLDQIKQLAELHSAGILTDEEFAAKKASILGI